jgi:beta-galactosidase
MLNNSKNQQKMNAKYFNVPALIFFIIFISGNILLAQRETVNFNDNWFFAKGNPANASSSQFNESGWEKIKLPHDWAISGPFDPLGEGNTGKLPWKGEGWYRKHFTPEVADQNKKFYLVFDGVMASPKIYVNGTQVGSWDYGYNSFYIDITASLKFGKENVIAVYANTLNHGSRWYPGAGIYRKVQLIKTDQVHVDIWGTQVTTPIVENTSADVRIINTLNNATIIQQELRVENIILSPLGNELKRSMSRVTLKPGEKRDVEQTVTLFRPERWDIQNPAIHTVRTLIYKNNVLCDESQASFGVRTFKFTGDDGFHLNGRRVQIKGVCLHHDQGPLGAAFYPRAMERQLEIMKEMGCNAIRTSHNVPAPELLDLCDKMGFIVIDEIFDKYDNKADLPQGADFFEFAEPNVRNFVMRDRNHPSIVLWSVGNEISDVETNYNGGFKKLQAMVVYFKKYDATRPITLVCHIADAAKKRHFDFYDVTAYNYRRQYKTVHDIDPSKPSLIGESASTVSTRGFYELPLPKAKTDFTRSIQVSSYDLNAPEWAEIPDFDFMWQEEDKFCGGEFVWTGFDYIGEPTPYGDNITRNNKFKYKQEEVARSSYFGIVDLCGIPKDRYWLYRSFWAPEKQTTHILPHWNWEGQEGDTIPVFVYTNGDRAELFLNGKSLGFREKEPRSEDAVKRYRLRWNVLYTPGELKAVSYKAGEINGTAIVKTAGKATGITAEADRRTVMSKGNDLVYVTISVMDGNGNFCPLDASKMRFRIEGPGIIKAVGNGDATSMESFAGTEMKAFYGKCLAIVETKGISGTIKLIIESDGLKPGEVNISIK